MRIAIITRSAEIRSTERLQKAAADRGHEVVIVPIAQGYVALSDGAVAMMAREATVRDIDAVIPRITTHHPFHGLSLLRQFELAGCYAFNHSRAIEACRDKFLTLAYLNREGVPIPRTVLIKDPERVPWALEQVGGPPVVLKPVSGSQGQGVVRGDTYEGARSMMEALLILDQHVLVQECISESAGRHLRIIVCGEDVVAGVWREAPPGHFRSNVDPGGRRIAVEPDEELSSLALRATKSLDLEVAGVDILESHHGPLVIEVNASPGVANIEDVTGLDVAGRFVEHIEGHCGQPPTESL